MNLTTILQSKIAAKHLLDHPFYQRWNDGTLSPEELRDYAREYYHYSLAFPTFLSGVHMNSNDLALRQAILENLIEEERGPENHPELWLRFCDALDLDREVILRSQPSEKTKHLIDVMRALSRDGEVHEGLAALYAYESQVPAVAKAKIAGLAKHYSIEDSRSISFFTVHLEADVEHAKTAEELLRRLCDSETKTDEATEAVVATLGALYGFLDGVTRDMSEIVN